jgi:heme oxygenase
MSVIDLLRKETSYYHNLLDTHPKLSKVTSDEVKKEDYFQYLELFFGIHTLLEKQIENNIDANFPFEGRLDLLKDDIERSGIDVPLIKDVPFTLDENNVLGAYYVVEGSKLGGKFIANHLKSKLVSDQYRFSFLTHKPSYSWKNVLEKLNTIDPSEHIVFSISRRCCENIPIYIILR